MQGTRGCGRLAPQQQLLPVLPALTWVQKVPGDTSLTMAPVRGSTTLSVCHCSTVRRPEVRGAAAGGGGRVEGSGNEKQRSQDDMEMRALTPEGDT